MSEEEKKESMVKKTPVKKSADAEPKTAPKAKSKSVTAKGESQSVAKTAPLKKAETKPAAKKATEAAPKAVGKPKAKQPAKSGATVKVIQTGSPIGRKAVQRQTLVGLGLNKIGRERVLEDTPSVRGMINRVKHLVRVA